jgi:predicted solute-binding protein
MHPNDPSSHTTAPPLRLGVVDYLNMQPLVAGLDTAFGDRLALRHGTPSALARWLEAGEIDAGMVPVAALLAHPEWAIVRPPDGCASGSGSMIGSRGPVASVLVVGAGAPPADWRRLHPDSNSLTSNALARVILQRKHGLTLDIADPIPAADEWHPPADAAPGEAFVLIGSRALRWRNWAAELGRPATALDLGFEWTDWTGLPLVCAVWAARPGVDLGDWPVLLEQHKQRNRARLTEIAAAWPDLEYDRLTPAQAHDYLVNNIDCDLDPSALEGLERFRKEWAGLGLSIKAKK